MRDGMTLDALFERVSREHSRERDPDHGSYAEHNVLQRSS